MSEFKFLCPECGQKILCDASLTGTQITCPACQKNLTIPAAPMSAPPARLQPSAATAAAVMSAPPPVTDLPPPRAAQPAFAARTAPADPSHYSWLAIASLVSSVFLLFGFIPGIICGHLAKARMRKDVFLEGEKIANAGLVISYCVLIVTLVFATVGLAVRGHFHPTRTVLSSGDASLPASRVVDEVTINETEEEHDLEGSHEPTTLIGTKKGRKASRGGYFSYTMKALPHEPMTLNCRYWGGEPRGRWFDIAIDGQVIATQKLDHDAPNKFFDVEYKIPIALTRGKTSVTVQFQARPAWTAGTVYGCQMLRR